MISGGGVLFFFVWTTNEVFKGHSIALNATVSDDVK